MKKSFLLITLLSQSLFAATKTYDLTMDLSQNGQLISSPRLVINDGEQGIISVKDQKYNNTIEVTATDTKSSKGIMLDIVVSKTSASGKKIIISKPQVEVKLDTPAQFSVLNNENNEQINFSMLVREKSI